MAWFPLAIGVIGLLQLLLIYPVLHINPLFFIAFSIALGLALSA